MFLVQGDFKSVTGHDVKKKTDSYEWQVEFECEMNKQVNSIIRKINLQ